MALRTGRDSAAARENYKRRRAHRAGKLVFRKRHAVEWLEQRVLLSATPTSIAISVSSSSIVYGQPMTLTATISGPLSAPSEGTVVFFDDGTLLATAQVSSGFATLDDVRLPAGADLITASYIDPSGTFASSSTAVGPHSTIETVAGGILQNGLPAVNASISPRAVAVDSSGDLFIADDTLDVVFEANHATGVITTVAGNGTTGFSGDGGPATGAQLGTPEGIAVDSSGNLFIADTYNNRIREVDLATGTINTVAGNGASGVSGDGGPATTARIGGPTGIAVDSSGNLFIADSNNNRVREVDHATGVIATVAGNGTAGFSGDGGPATAAEFNSPQGVAVDSSGDLFIADTYNKRIREVDHATGAITTVAGIDTYGNSGDGGPATAAELFFPIGVAVDSSGDLFLVSGNRIREVNHATGVITTVAGNEVLGFSGDGGPATAAELNGRHGIAVDSSGNLFIADNGNNRVREVNHSTGTITTVAGNGTRAFSGDGGPATAAQVDWPQNIAFDSSGDLLIADASNNRIREINRATGVITTVAGNGTAGFSGDGGAATAAELNGPQGIAVDSSGDLFIADTYNNRIREVNPATGIITTVAGYGAYGFSGDGGPATAAELSYPGDVTVDSSGDLFIAEPFDNRIREVNHSTGTITTVAGNGTSGDSGDGGPATAAELDHPEGIAVDSLGDLFIADGFNNRVREVNLATGIITTVAGNGLTGFNGDGGPATAAELHFPTGIAVDSSGDLFIGDTGNYRVREVNLATGIITTVAGNGTAGFSGDGGPAGAAEFSVPLDVGVDPSGDLAVNSSGDLFIADIGNNRVREMSKGAVVAVTPATLTVTANGATRAYGAPNPTFTDTITGFVNGDTSSVVNGAASLNTTATTTSPVGSYPIAAALGTLSAANYNFAFQNGALTVAPSTSFVVNDATYTIGFGTIAVSAGNGLLGSDTGPSPLTVTAGTATGAQGGTFAFSADGSFAYTPPASFPGFDYAQYTVRDTVGDQATATVNVLSQTGSVVWKFYEQVLKRDPDYPGLQYWINDLSNGGKTGDIAASFFESDELLDKVLGNYYQQYLHRPLDESGLKYWKSVWHATGGPEQIQAGFAASLEFFNSSGGTPDSWVDALYQRILRRTPDPQGKQFWLNNYQQQVAAGIAPGTVRYQIALAFLDSAESYGQDVAGWFAEYLFRAPTDAEKARYVAQMEGGTSDRTIEQVITNLPEYANNPPTPPAGTATPLPDYAQTPAASASSQAVVSAKDAVFSGI